MHLPVNGRGVAHFGQFVHELGFRVSFQRWSLSARRLRYWMARTVTPDSIARPMLAGQRMMPAFFEMRRASRNILRRLGWRPENRMQSSSASVESGADFALSDWSELG